MHEQPTPDAPSKGQRRQPGQRCSEHAKESHHVCVRVCICVCEGNRLHEAVTSKEPLSTWPGIARGRADTDMRKQAAVFMVLRLAADAGGALTWVTGRVNGR